MFKVQCCGEYQCKQLECNGKLTVDSKINEGVKLSCCGTEDCESVACEGYTVANTPKGEVACCGYADCQNKKCEGQTAIEINGTVYACCGKENCNQVYEENKFKAIQEETELYVAKRLDVKADYRKDENGTWKLYKEYSVGASELCNGCHYQCGCDGTICYESKCLPMGLIAPITILNYPKSGTKKECKTVSKMEYVHPGEKGCNSCTGPCRILTYRQECEDVPQDDISLYPKTAKESVWYGKTVVTNYTNCMREHGVFTAYHSDLNGKHLNGYNYSTYQAFTEDFSLNLFTIDHFNNFIGVAPSNLCNYYTCQQYKNSQYYYLSQKPEILYSSSNSDIQHYMNPGVLIYGHDGYGSSRNIRRPINPYVETDVGLCSVK